MATRIAVKAKGGKTVFKKLDLQKGVIQLALRLPIDKILCNVSGLGRTMTDFKLTSQLAARKMT